MNIILLFIFILSARAWQDCSPETDGHFPHNGTRGPFSVKNFTMTWEDKPLVVITPEANQSFPLFVFMHGSTGQLWFYYQNLEILASHGFVVIFPYVKSPEDDKSPFTTNTDGTYIIHGLELANSSLTNTSSPLHGKVDMENFIIAGHSMGATCSINSIKKAASDKISLANLKLVIS